MFIVDARRRARQRGRASVCVVRCRPLILIEGLRAARLPGEVVRDLLTSQLKVLLDKLFLAMLTVAIQVLKHAWVISEVLVVVFYNDTSGLEHVPRIIDSPPQIRLLAAAPACWGLLVALLVLATSATGARALLLLARRGEVAVIPV